MHISPPKHGIIIKQDNVFIANKFMIAELSVIYYLKQADLVLPTKKTATKRIGINLHA